MSPVLLRRSWSVTVIMLVILAAGPGRAVECPPSPGDVEATVSSKVHFLPDTEAFVYRYTITNAPSSPLEVDGWAVRFSSLPSSVPADTLHELQARAPETWGWGKMYSSKIMMWNPLPPFKEGAADSTPPPVKSQIKPGRTVSGFGLESSDPPGLQPMWLSGYVSWPRAASETEAERIASNCSLESVGTWTQKARRGLTYAPSRALRVGVDVLPGDTANRISAVNQDTVPVALLGSDTFAVDKASDTATLFGRSMTEPTRPGHVRDVNGDGWDDLVFSFPVEPSGIEQRGARTVALSVTLVEPMVRDDTSFSVAWGTDILSVTRPNSPDR